MGGVYDIVGIHRQIGTYFLTIKVTLPEFFKKSF